MDMAGYQNRLKSSKPDRVSCTGRIRKKFNIWCGISYQGPTKFSVLFFIIKIENKIIICFACQLN